MEKKQKVVMVVEDEKLLLHAISKKLGLNGFAVLPYADGELAIADLLSHKASPDIIWLDYYLGIMNGVDFVTKMKENKLAVPVVIVSNSASDVKVKNDARSRSEKIYFEGALSPRGHHYRIAFSFKRDIMKL